MRAHVRSAASRAMMTSVLSGRCGPCASIAPTGSKMTAPLSADDASGQVRSASITRLSRDIFASPPRKTAEPMRGILAAGGGCCDRVVSQGLELMKLIFAVVHDQDVDALFRALATSGFRATRIASTGGYLRTANATVFIGVEDDEVAHCREIIVQTCRRRAHRLPIDLTDVD